MANILITGANGFLGTRLAATMPLGSTVRLNGRDEMVERLVLVDHLVTDSKNCADFTASVTAQSAPSRPDTPHLKLWCFALRHLLIFPDGMFH